MSVEGYSAVSTHFGELLQGLFYDGDGVLERGLVTLRCPLFKASAEFFPSDSEHVQVTPHGSIKAARAAEIVLQKFHIKKGGCLRLDSQIPLGIGAGSSTGDVVSSIQAVASSHSIQLTPELIAQIALEAEDAIDPLMYGINCEVLFAHRKGKIISHLPGVIPTMGGLACIDGEPVDTLSNPLPSYDKFHVNEFDRLICDLRTAIAKSDCKKIANVATRSAELNQSFLAKPHFQATLEVATKCDALGVAVSHSGSAVTLLFDSAWGSSQVAEATERLHFAGLNVLGVFKTTNSEDACQASASEVSSRR
jgi:uncharacterized protein involved in propanediol utilization